MNRITLLAASVLTLTLIGVGCQGESESDETAACSVGDLFAFDGTDYCLVIEEGFLTSDCPEDYPEGKEFGDAVVCGEEEPPDEIEEELIEDGVIEGDSEEEPTPDPNCPDADDPSVSYLSEDPAGCATIDWVCVGGAEAFDNECGCGCIVGTGDPCANQECADEDPCTVDSCVDGECLSAPLDCDDEDPCTVDSCAEGECQNTPLDCDDSDECTEDTCAAGECVNSAIEDCAEPCGGCEPGEECVDDECVEVCVPQCGEKNCGADGCGGSCGACSQGQGCTEGSCTTCPDPQASNVVYISPDPEGCAAADWECGEGSESFDNECGCGCILFDGDPCLDCSEQMCLDIDGDEVGDYEDNCTAIANPDQTDTDGDHYGNACDGDFNQDGVVDGIDFDSYMVPAYLSGVDNGEGTDMNGDGVVDAADLLDYFMPLFESGWPGPSGLSCAGKSCGDDGCGGSCGQCAPGVECLDGTCLVCPDPNDPLVSYFSEDPATCASSDWEPADKETCKQLFDNECGCGCILYEEAPCEPQCAEKSCGDDGCGGTCGECEVGTECVDGACSGCPDPEDENVFYYSQDLEVCNGGVQPDWACNEGLEFFDNECGCGCVGPEEQACVPDCTDASCGDDGCGGTCGECDGGTWCIDGGCTDCPDGELENVEYISLDPMQCMLIDYGCEQDDGPAGEAFDGPCGCGCIY